MGFGIEDCWFDVHGVEDLEVGFIFFGRVIALEGDFWVSEYLSLGCLTLVGDFGCVES